MEPKKFNWGTLILGIIIGAMVVGIVWAASKPATTEGQVPQDVVSCVVGRKQNSLIIARPGLPNTLLYITKADLSDVACAALNQ